MIPNNDVLFPSVQKLSLAHHLHVTDKNNKKTTKQQIQQNKNDQKNKQ